MSSEDSRASARLRWSAYALLIAIAVGNMTGRLMAVNSVNREDLEHHLINRRIQSLERDLQKRGLDSAEIEAKLEIRRPKIEAAERRQRPFLSSNDRSRWLAIRALVDHGTFEIDGIIDRHVWNTIDMVQHKNRDGEERLYSSKPPLLITILAGEYWLLQKATGLNLADQPYAVVRIILFTANVLPLALLIWIVASLAERFATTDWARLYVVAGAAFGTLLSTFAIVLNNHVIGAVSAAAALYALVRIWFDGDDRVRWYALCGLAAAFTAANELPALALLVGMGLVLLWHNARAWALGFLPAAGLVVAAFFATNLWAHDSWRPPYMHRSETNAEDNWYVFTYTIDGRERQSYWSDPTGVDRGEPSVSQYAWHALAGHHGIFSLTPMWLLAALGLGIWTIGDAPKLRQLAGSITALSLICLAFYIAGRPQEDRNYGGMTSGFRWMFWFAPLWLVAMIPALDRAAESRWLKFIALALLAASVFSASFPTWNPWSIPWIEHVGMRK